MPEKKLKIVVETEFRHYNAAGELIERETRRAERPLDEVKDDGSSTG